MAKRDILNHEGIKIGEMAEPEGVTWTEEQWQKKLAPFAAAPLSPEEQLSQMLLRAVKESRSIADEIIEIFKKQNLEYFIQNGVANDLAILMSLHVHHRLRAVEITVAGVSFTIDLLNLVISGDLETAFVVLSYMTPDSMEAPYHFLSQDRINALKALIQERVAL